MAQTRSSEQYRYEAYSGREVRRKEQESSYHGVSQPYDTSYQHKNRPRDLEILALQDRGQYWVPSTEKHTSPTTQSPYQPGPPKPPRRQESLNRIHIPSGPDYDDDPKSPSDMDLSLTSPESGSPKQWQTSPLAQPQRVFALTASPTSLYHSVSREQGYPNQQANQTSSVMTSSNHNQREYSQAYTKQQSYYLQGRDRGQPQAVYKPPPSSPQRQPKIMRQSSLPESHSSPQTLSRTQNVQRAASFDRRPDSYGPKARDDVPRRSHPASRSPQRYSTKTKREPESQTSRTDPKVRTVSDRQGSDRQGSRSMGRPAQRGSPPRRPPIDPRHRKVSSPERGVAMVPKGTPRRSSFPDAHIERFIVPDKLTGTYASPQYQPNTVKPTPATTKAKKSGLGALLLSDKDYDTVNMDSVSWLLDNNNLSKPEYISDSGVSSIREGSMGPQAQPFVAPVHTALSYDYDFPIKPETQFPEESAQYKLYGDGPMEYPSYGNNEEKFQSKPSPYKHQFPDDNLSKQNPVSYSPSSAGKNRQEHLSRRDQHRQILRSSSQESSEKELKTFTEAEPKRQLFRPAEMVDHSGGRISYYPSNQQSSRNSIQQQDSTSDRSPKKALFKSDVPDWGQYRHEEIKPLVAYKTEVNHYDYPKKSFPSMQDSPKSGPNYHSHDLYSRPLANGQRIKASPDRYTTGMVEADRMGIEPAIDGGEAYWGMESKKPASRLVHQQRSLEQVPNYSSTPDAYMGGRKETSTYYRRDNTQGVSSRSSMTAQEIEIKRKEEIVDQSALSGERQSRYDRLKQRAGVRDIQPRSKSLTRLDRRDEALQSLELSSNDTLSKSTDDLDELRKKGFSRGAALFMRMMQQASMEEDNYDFQAISPVSVDSYVGTPKLFQPQITKTGEPILDLVQPDFDSPSKVPLPKEEPPCRVLDQGKVDTAPPKGKTSDFDHIPTTHWRDRVQTERQNEQKHTKDKPNSVLATQPITYPDIASLVTTRHGNQEVPVEWLIKQEGLRRTPVGGKRSTSPTKYTSLIERSPSPTKHVEESLVFPGKQEGRNRTPVEKNASPSKQEELKRMPSVEKNVPSSIKQEGLKRMSVEKYSASFTKQEEFKQTTFVEKNLISPANQEGLKSTPVGKNVATTIKHEGLRSTSSVEKKIVSPTKQDVLNHTPFSGKSLVSPIKQVGSKQSPFIEKRSASPAKLKFLDSEPIQKARRGKQDIPIEWLEVLDRLRGKPKGQSSESSGYPSPPSKHEKSHRVSADFEDALSELEYMYSILDEEADELMFHKSHRPFDERISELPLVLQKRLKDLKEYAISQRNKRRARRDRAKSDVATKTHAAEARKSHEITPLRQSISSAAKLSKPTSLDLPAKTSDLRYRTESSRKEQSSSDEEASSQQHNAAQLYRRPKSSDNLGYSSDSSPSPDHTRQKYIFDFGKPESSTGKPESRFEMVTGLVLPEYIPSSRSHGSKSKAPMEDPVKVNTLEKKATSKKVQEVITKTSAVDVKAGQSMFETLDAGSRVSIDSVSTVDSYQLSQPFDEISSEYHKISNDHRMDVASDEDISPGQQSSSMESLVQSVSNSGNGLKRRSTQKKGKESPADGGLRTGEKTKSMSSGPVPLATFDEEIGEICFIISKLLLVTILTNRNKLLINCMFVCSNLSSTCN